MWLLALWTGCAQVDTLPGLAPPPVTLSATAAPQVGGSLEVELLGLPAGASWALVVADGGVGQGSCPAPLGGACMGMLPGGLGYRVIEQGVAAGDVQWRATVPAAVAPGMYQLQAVVFGQGLSNVVELDVSRPCADPLEPNDALAAATPWSGPWSDLYLCPTGDHDWFEVEVAPWSSVELTAQLRASDGDLDLELVDAGGYLLDGSFRLGDEESVLWYNDSDLPQTAWLHAYAVHDAGRDGVRYSLERSDLAAAPCVADAHEPDDDPAQAALVLPGVYVDHTACGEPDWLVVDVAAGEVVTARVAGVPGEGEVAVALYDAGGAELVAAGPWSSWAATVNTRVWLKVLLRADDAVALGTPYTLEVGLQASRACATDALEPNDGRASAVPLAPGLYTGLDVCGDDDWYEVSLRAGETAELVLRSDPADGNANAIVMTRNGFPLRFAVTEQAEELMRWTANTNAVYLVRVAATSDAGAPVLGGVGYTLEFDVQ
jgi:hypothetical protein